MSKIEEGDIVRILDSGIDDHSVSWGAGEIGIIVGMGKRLYIPAAKVMVLGEVAEFDLGELEKIYAR